MREKPAKFEKEIYLDLSGVDEASSAMREWMQTNRISAKDAAQLRLTMEVLLETISNHFNGDIRGTLVLEKRFGRPRLSFIYESEDNFDPTKKEETSGESWVSYLKSQMGFAPVWKHGGSYNEVLLRDPFLGYRYEIVLLVSMILAIIAGVSGSILPPSLVEYAELLILTPVSELFMQLLGMFAGIFIFMSVLTGICGAGSAGEFGRIGKLMIRRYIVITFIGGALSLLMARPFFRIPFERSGDAASQLQAIMDILISIVPGNPVTPFAEGNTIQIIFMALVIGILMLMLRNRIKGLKDLILQANDLFSTGIRFVCSMLPLYIFCSVTLQLWENGIEIIIKMYKPILVSIALSAVFIAVYALITSLRVKVSAAKILGKISPAVLIAFTTASSSAAFGTCMEINSRKLGISPKISNIGVPVGAILFVPAYTQIFLLTAFYAAEIHGIGGGLSWYIVMWIVCTILAMACPPVAGGALICLGVLFTQLGIPASALGLAASLSIFIDFCCTGTKIALIELELVQEASILGMIDLQKLNA